jgi:predicted DNA binding CopG/RHH family protein
MARPRSADATGKTAADKVIALRVNTTQYKALKKAASAAGMSVSAYLRVTVTKNSSAA